MHSKPFLRRPSTWLVLGAGLLTADLLRSPVGAWTDAAHFFGGLLLAICALALWRRRKPHRREVELLALPARAKPSSVPGAVASLKAVPQRRLPTVLGTRTGNPQTPSRAGQDFH